MMLSCFSVLLLFFFFLVYFDSSFSCLTPVSWIFSLCVDVLRIYFWILCCLTWFQRVEDVGCCGLPLVGNRMWVWSRRLHWHGGLWIGFGRVSFEYRSCFCLRSILWLFSFQFSLCFLVPWIFIFFFNMTESVEECSLSNRFLWDIRAFWLSGFCSAWFWQRYWFFWF